MGGATIRTNLELLKAARQAVPDAHLVYKPHPDVVAALSPALAYQAGRDYQRGQDETREPRRRLLDEWPRTKGKLLDEWPEAVAYLPDPKALTAGRVKDDDDD